MADDNKPNPHPLGLHRLAWVVGFIGLPLSHYWLAGKKQPLYLSLSFFFFSAIVFSGGLIFLPWIMRFGNCVAARCCGIARKNFCFSRSGPCRCGCCSRR